MSVANQDDTIWGMKITPNAKLLLLSIHRNTGTRTGICEASDRELAEETGLSRNVVRKALDELFHFNYVLRRKDGFLLLTVGL